MSSELLCQTLISYFTGPSAVRNYLSEGLAEVTQRQASR
ncbi:hypothetical protein GGP66_003407 [Salinibacter ruber]|nr:hypothetical protein [Salinibacter ruber]